MTVCEMLPSGMVLSNKPVPFPFRAQVQAAIPGINEIVRDWTSEMLPLFLRCTTGSLKGRTFGYLSPLSSA